MGSKKRETEKEKAASKAKSAKKARGEDTTYDPKSSSAARKNRSGQVSPTAAAAAGHNKAGSPPPPPPYQPETSELEKKRMGVSDELRHVERQIFDLETKYLEQSSAFGNAVRGYEGFLGGVGVANRKIVIKSEERLFSSSSLTGQVTAQD